MKKITFIAASLLLIAGSYVFAEDEMDDFDSMFDDAEDTEEVQEKAPVTQTEETADYQQSMLTFSGSLSMTAGGIFIVPDTATPYASMEAYFGFTARPFPELTVKSKLYTSFPSFSLSLYSFSVDYIMLDKVYVTAGRTRTTWGNSFIFDTNLLDDSSSDLYSDKTYDTYQFINGNDNNASNDFFLIGTVPFSKGEATALAKYESTSTLSRKYISYAAAVEYPVAGINLSLFARKWSEASLAENGKAPAFGASATGDIKDFHFNLWGSFNMPLEAETRITYGRFVGGISRYWSSNPKMAVTAEYMFTYDAQNSEAAPEISNKAGFKWAWSHVANSWFSPSLQYFGNFAEGFGTVIPGITVSGVPGLRNAQLTVSTPVLYGNQTYTYKGVSITSTAEKPAVIFAAAVTLNASY